uniref:Sorting nexin-17 n=2 Tax=Ciona intestinalis TaxID=7719 RepID=F6ZN60_CIOIN
MHFSIPDTEEIEDSTGSSYKVFNVHVNGVLHCSVRYSQLHDLNNQFRKELKLKTLPQFPPKKLLQLNDSNLKERRVQLEKYIQEVSQDPMLSNSDIFNAFLRRAQQETRREESIPVSLNIYLLNGSKVQLNISSTDQTDDVLENTIVTIGLPEDLTYYFGLYLVRSDNQPTVIRQLQDFECPYISLKSLNDRRLYKIVIRKSYWDQCYDEIYKTDRTALNLLHSQAENDVKVGWTGCSDAAKVQLTTFNKRGSKKEFLELCQTLQNYGYI